MSAGPPRGPLLGQGAEYARMLRAARALRLPHGLLVDGPLGVGKTHACGEIASALLCESATDGATDGDAAADDAPCRVCAACRKVATHNHPDLHVLAPPPDKQDIPVELVRALQARLARSPVEGRARVVLVDPADRLNEQGQNALLKTLEEPGPATFLLLATTRPESLLPTVRSRLARLRVRPLQDAAVRGILLAGRDIVVDAGVDAGADAGADADAVDARALDPDVLDAAVARAQGSVGWARTLCDPDVAAVDAAIGRFLSQPERPGPEVSREILQNVSGRAETDERARAALRALRNRVRGQLQRCLADGDTARYVESLAERWTTVLEAVFAAEDDLRLGIGVSAVLDGTLLTIAEVLSGRRTSLQPNPIDP